MSVQAGKYTIQQVWGFGNVEAVEADIPGFLIALNAAATSRGIASHLPSDALDLSRDSILDEAAQSVGADWHIAPGVPLSTLRLARTGLSVDWPEVD